MPHEEQMYGLPYLDSAAGSASMGAAALGTMLNPIRRDRLLVARDERPDRLAPFDFL